MYIVNAPFLVSQPPAAIAFNENYKNVFGIA